VEDIRPALDPSTGIGMSWTWCAHCQRAYVTGASRRIRFTSDALNPHPTNLTLCPYFDCSANANRYGWQWGTIRQEHPEYPVTPKQGQIYAR
jgi:hypothetical protein